MARLESIDDKHLAGLKGVLKQAGIVGTDGEAVIPQFVKKDQDTTLEPWQMQSLPTLLLQDDSYDSSSLQRVAWNEVIKPFQEEMVNNGERPQNLRGVWQVEIEVENRSIYRRYARENNIELSEFVGTRRRTSRVGPPEQRSKMIEY